MQPRRQLTIQLRRAERIGGWIYLPIYLLGLSMVLGAVFALLGYDVTDSSVMARINLIYGFVNLLVIAILFRHYLAESLIPVAHHPLRVLGYAALGYVIYYGGTLVMTLIINLIQPDVTNANNEAVSAMALDDLPAMVVFSVLLAPIVEETLFRGLIFSTLHRRSRLAAYAVSMLAFSLIHVAGYVFQYPIGQLALTLLQYLPAGFALAWIYERTDTVWTSVITHMAVNGVSMLAVGYLGQLS